MMRVSPAQPSRPAAKPSPTTSDQEQLGPDELDPAELLDVVDTTGDDVDEAGDSVGLGDLLLDMPLDANVDGEETAPVVVEHGFDLEPPEIEGGDEAGERNEVTELDIGFLPADASFPVDDGTEGPEELLELESELPALDADDDAATIALDIDLGLDLALAPALPTTASPVPLEARSLAKGDWECMTLVRGVPWLAGSTLAVLTAGRARQVVALRRRVASIAGLASSTRGADEETTTCLVMATRLGTLTCASVHGMTSTDQHTVELTHLDGSDFHAAVPRLVKRDEDLWVFLNANVFRFDSSTRTLAPASAEPGVVDITEDGGTYALVEHAGGFAIRERASGKLLQAPKADRANGLRLFGMGQAVFAYAATGELVAHAAAGARTLHATLEQPLLAAAFSSEQHCWLAVRTSRGVLRVLHLLLLEGRAEIVFEDEESVDPDDECQMCFDPTLNTLYLLVGGRLLSLDISDSRLRS